jgi:hypothetical protein
MILDCSFISNLRLPNTGLNKGSLKILCQIIEKSKYL